MSQLNNMEDFERNISYRLLKKGDGTATLTALMTDRFHDVEVNVTVDDTTLEIISAGAEFRRSPTTDCRNVSLRLQGLIGFQIGRGLNKRVTDALGGSEGCGNVRNLLLGLLPLALNLRAAAGITDEREMLDNIHEQLRGTCAGYLNPVPER